MPETNRFLYRGTTPGWPGNLSLHGNARTCATTDPFVATLFAIECLQHGPAIVLVAAWDSFEGSFGPTNHAAIFESEVVVNVAPTTFASRSIFSLDAQQSRDLLIRIGFERLPVRIGGKSALREAILQSYNDSDRLSMDQIRDFNLNAMGNSP